MMLNLETIVSMHGSEWPNDRNCLEFPWIKLLYIYMTQAEMMQSEKGERVEKERETETEGDITREKEKMETMRGRGWKCKREGEDKRDAYERDH